MRKLLFIHNPRSKQKIQAILDNLEATETDPEVADMVRESVALEWYSRRRIESDEGKKLAYYLAWCERNNLDPNQDHGGY